MDRRVVRAHWDNEAKVWWASSDDIPGLVSEAATFEDLRENVSALIPDLLELNRVPDRDMPIELIATCSLKVVAHKAS